MQEHFAPTERQVAHARQLISDPALFDKRPSLRQLAWWTLHTAKGRPCRQARRPATSGAGAPPPDIAG
jgi:hypothetical protein